ncbi:MAG: hypothetical protein Q8P57_01515 [Candidatus Pacearchaeota archaeon]|nr:hypothetical protein [Candidatus Pacearchaeota archaeon]
METQKLREDVAELKSLAEKLGYEEPGVGTKFIFRDRTQEVSVEEYRIPFKKTQSIPYKFGCDMERPITFLDPSGRGIANSFICHWSEFPDRLGLMGMPGAMYYGDRYRNYGRIGFLIIGKVESEDEHARQFNTHSDLVNAARAYVLKGDNFHTVLKAKHLHVRLDASSSVSNGAPVKPKERISISRILKPFKHVSNGAPVEPNERGEYMGSILWLAEKNPSMNIASQDLVDEYIKQFSFHEEEEEVKRRLDALGDDFKNQVSTKRSEFGNGAIEIDSYRDAVFGCYEYRKAQVDAIDLMTINNHRIEGVKEEVDRIRQIRKVLPRHSLGLLQNLV